MMAAKFVQNTFLNTKTLLMHTPSASIKSVQTDGRFFMGHLKKRYLKRNPIIVAQKDGTVKIEGVSDKQFPLPAVWKAPEHICKSLILAKSNQRFSTFFLFNQHELILAQTHLVTWESSPTK